MTFRYIGNKTRHLPHLVPALTALTREKAVIADPMCGTASVSAALRDAGYRVVAADQMTFAYFHAVVRLKLRRTPPFKGLGQPYDAVLQELNSLKPWRGPIYREYGDGGQPRNKAAPRKYLSAGNAGRVDAIVRRIARWEQDDRLTPAERALLKHDLVLAVNRVANIAGTYGHYRSSWTNGSLAGLALAPSTFGSGRTDHSVLHGRVEDLAASIEADLCYLDPPYTKRQYAANYHLIETIARGDAPEAVGVSGLRPWRDQYSDFCSKVRIRDAFAEVFTNMKCRRFAISYSEDGLLTKDQMLEFLRGFGRVTSHEWVVPRFRSNQSLLGKHLSEFLFVLTV